VGGSGGRDRVGDIEAISTRCSVHSALNVCSDITLGAGAKQSGRRPLFFYNTVIVGGGGRGNKDGGKGPSGLDQFDKFFVVSSDPLFPEGASERRGESKRLAKRVEIEDRCRAMSHIGGKSGWF
jgi:hypothetical protein